MPKLSRTSLKDLTSIFVFANTPKSLFKAILSSSTYKEILGGSSYEELAKSYNDLTVRARRTPMIAALSYAILIALLKKAKHNDRVDCSRLDWGDHLKQLFDQTQNNSNIIVLDMSESLRAPTGMTIQSGALTLIHSGNNKQDSSIAQTIII
jgi:hypothetical protein